MNLKKLGAALVFVLPMLIAMPKAASATSIGFTCITNNNGNCSSFAGYFNADLTITSTGNMKAIVNNVGPAGAGIISEIFFDLPGTGAGYTLTGLVESPPAVDFTNNSGNPSSLPSGNNAVPAFVTEQYSTANSPSPTSGIGPGETLTLLFSVPNAFNQSALDAALADGSLRLGLHIQSVGNGQSESFVNGCANCTPTQQNSVPEPASMLLLGTGLLAAARARRRNA